MSLCYLCFKASFLFSILTLLTLPGHSWGQISNEQPEQNIPDETPAYGDLFGELSQPGFDQGQAQSNQPQTNRPPNCITGRNSQTSQNGFRLQGMPFPQIGLTPSLFYCDNYGQMHTDLGQLANLLSLDQGMGLRPCLSSTAIGRQRLVQGQPGGFGSVSTTPQNPYTNILANDSMIEIMQLQASLVPTYMACLSNQLTVSGDVSSLAQTLAQNRGLGIRCSGNCPCQVQCPIFESFAATNGVGQMPLSPNGFNNPSPVQQGGDPNSVLFDSTNYPNYQPNPFSANQPQYIQPGQSGNNPNENLPNFGRPFPPNPYDQPRPLVNNTSFPVQILPPARTGPGFPYSNQPNFGPGVQQPLHGPQSHILPPPGGFAVSPLPYPGLRRFPPGQAFNFHLQIRPTPDFAAVYQPGALISPGSFAQQNSGRSTPAGYNIYGNFMQQPSHSPTANVPYRPSTNPHTFGNINTRPQPATAPQQNQYGFNSQMSAANPPQNPPYNQATYSESAGAYSSPGIQNEWSNSEYGQSDFSSTNMDQSRSGDFAAPQYVGQRGLAVPRPTTTRQTTTRARIELPTLPRSSHKK